MRAGMRDDNLCYNFQFLSDGCYQFCENEAISLKQASQTFFGDSFMILCSFFGIFYAILCQFQQNFMPFYAHFTENFMLSNECFPSLNIRSSMKYQIPFRFLPSFPLFL